MNFNCGISGTYAFCQVLAAPPYSKCLHIYTFIFIPSRAVAVFLYF